jgi:hypothetical protein
MKKWHPRLTHINKTIPHVEKRQVCGTAGGTFKNNSCRQRLKEIFN